MERHLNKDSTRRKRTTAREVGHPLDAADLALVTGEKGPVLAVQDDKGSETKRAWGVYSANVARKKAAEPAADGPAKRKGKTKKNAAKAAGRPAAVKARPERERHPS